MTSQNTAKERGTVRVMLTPEEAAKYLGVKPQTLAKWRHRKIGPNHTKLVGAVRYDRDELDRYIEANTTTAATVTAESKAS